MRRGVDSAFAPNFAQASLVKALGYDWWGCYLSGSAARNLWTPTQVQILKAAGLLPLPIVVPSQNFAENPTLVAETFVASCEAAGVLSGGVVLDVEHGAPLSWYGWASSWATVITALGYTPDIYDGTHTLRGPRVWEPVITSSLPTPAPGRAIQWSSGAVEGLSVDLDVADDSFPLGSWDPRPQPSEEVHMKVAQFGADGQPGSGMRLVRESGIPVPIDPADLAAWLAFCGQAQPAGPFSLAMLNDFALPGV